MQYIKVKWIHKPRPTHIKVKWIHSDSELPVTLYSELNKDRFETRKVEVFADGRCGYASATEVGGTTKLGLEPVPPLSDIAADPEFEPFEITKEQFEQLWHKRRTGKS